MQSELEPGRTIAVPSARAELRRELHVALDRAFGAPAAARHAVSRWLMDHGCPARLVVNMTLVTSELVTNAVVHAGSAPHLTAVIGSGRLRLEVHDEAEEPPVRRASMSVAGGRGLHVVEAVAERWGWSPTERGKYVWAEMSYDDLHRPADVFALEKRRFAEAATAHLPAPR